MTLRSNITGNKVATFLLRSFSHAVSTSFSTQELPIEFSDLAMAFLDRLVERAINLKVTGKTYRAWLTHQAAEVESAKKVSKGKAAGRPGRFFTLLKARA